ncbi:MAG: DUF885 family protein [Gemmatimonadaceae bacterium]|nr:DUF885 family protein [Gemmatimonadaceae bacterium]
MRENPELPAFRKRSYTAYGERWGDYASIVAHMRAHVLESDTQIASESLRYSTDIPGQALAHRIGSNGFVRLRERARAQLGERFDLRAFHDRVLGCGMLPMSVLAQQVDGWIASQR